MERSVSAQENITKYKSYLILNPDDLDTLIKLSQTYIDNNQYSEAIDILLKIEKLAPHNDKMKFLIAQLFEDCGKYIEAEIYYHKCLELNPSHFHALLKLGCLELKLNKFNDAKKNFLSLIQLSSDPELTTNAYNDLGVIAMTQDDDLQTALNYFEKAIALNPQNYNAYINLSSTLTLLDELEHALETLEKIPLTDDLEVSIILQKSKIMMRKKQVDEAIQMLVDLSELYPENSNIYHQIAVLYGLKEQHETVKEYLLKTKSLATNPIPSLFNLSKNRIAVHDYLQAKKYLEEVLEIDPANLDAYVDLGRICFEEENFDGAITCLEIALGFDDSNAQIWVYLSMAYYEQDLKEKAIECLLKALEISPDDPDILSNLCGTAMHNKREEAARQLAFNSFKRLLEKFEKDKENKNPVYFTTGQTSAIAFYAHLSIQNGYWDEFKRIEPLLKLIVDEQTEAEKFTGLSAFSAQFIIDSEKYHLKITQGLAKSYAVDKSKRFANHIKKYPNKFRIGYISPDFNNHVVGFLIKDLFSYHHRDKFEIFCYALTNKNDETQAIIRKSCDHFVDVSNHTAYDTAKQIYDDQIDILIDLAGYTKNCRTKVLSYQPAPVQAHFLGQTGTMGADYIQYHIASPEFVPQEQLSQYEEQIVYLPETPIAVNPYSVPEELPKKSNYNLPEDKFIFCCFNNSYRFNPEVFGLWIQILQQVPDSVIWLNSPSQCFEDNMKKYAASQDMDPNRFIFRPHQILNSDWHHRLADIYLDTTIISGGTTGILSAWIGLPVITLAGKTPQSRFGAGIMRAAGGEQFIVHSTEQYVQKAASLAKDRETLKEIKQAFQKTARSSPLFNQKRYIEFLEKGYEQMWLDHTHNKRQKEIYVK